MKMLKGFENWTEIERRVASDGSQRIVYKLGNYHITVTDANYMPGGISISARCIESSRYTPEIYVDTRHSKNDDFQTVSIQTSSWGALEIAEIDEVVKAYTEAQTVAHEIERAFPECFKVA